MGSTLKEFIKKLNEEIFPDNQSTLSQTLSKLEIFNIELEINVQMALDEQGNAGLYVIAKDDEVINTLSVQHIKMSFGPPPPVYPPPLSPSLPSPAMLPGDTTTDAPLPKPKAKRDKTKK